MNWDICKRGKISDKCIWTYKCAKFQPERKKWKIFHFGEKFSTSKKKNSSKITWIGTFARGGKFSTFGGKFSTLVKFVFWHQDLRVCQVSARMEEVENFPLWWKIFHLKKKIFQNYMNWNILRRGKFSDKSENFPLFRFLPKFRNCTHPGLKVCQVSAKLKNLFFR